MDSEKVDYSTLNVSLSSEFLNCSFIKDPKNRVSKEHLVFKIIRLPGESLSDLIDRLDLHKLDCSMFVQLVSAVKRDEKIILLVITSTKVAVILHISHYPELCYITVENNELYDILQKTNLDDKGQWVMPMGEDKYLGLSSIGPIVCSFSEWVERLCNGLFLFVNINLLKKNDILNNALAGIIYCINNLGEMDKWVMNCNNGKSSYYIRSTKQYKTKCKTMRFFGGTPKMDGDGFEIMEEVD